MQLLVGLLQRFDFLLPGNGCSRVAPLGCARRLSTRTHRPAWNSSALPVLGVQTAPHKRCALSCSCPCDGDAALRRSILVKLSAERWGGVRARCSEECGSGCCMVVHEVERTAAGVVPVSSVMGSVD
jgi:hypothetical protein